MWKNMLSYGISNLALFPLSATKKIPLHQLKMEPGIGIGNRAIWNSEFQFPSSKNPSYFLCFSCSSIGKFFLTSDSNSHETTPLPLISS
ncbi:hypothetical protein SLE2022_095660 [Rubroshorea leprosula]